MKKIFYIALLSILFLGCSKEKTELVFGEAPEERISEELAQWKSALVSAPNGWIAGMGTSAKGGYGFYMKFDDDDKVSMYSDYNAASAKTSQTSTYRLKWGMKGTLIFDTYNYLSIMQDPVPGVAGGAAGKGYQSDVEFEFARLSGDSAIFTGKKYQNTLVLVKATKTQEEQFQKGDYETSIAKFNSFFNTNAYLKLSINNVVQQVAFDLANKSLSFTSLQEDGAFNAKSAKFYYSMNTIEILDGLVIDNIVMKSFSISANGTLVALDAAGKEYNIEVVDKPVFPFELYFNYNKTYNAIYIEGSKMPAGVTSDFNTLWNNQIANYTANNVSMISMTFRLISSKQAKLEVWFRSGSTDYLADASYDYVISGNTIKLSNYVPSVSNANWNNGWVITAIKNYFIDAEFEMAWVASSTSKSAMIGGLIKKNTPTSFFYGHVKKM